MAEAIASIADRLRSYSKAPSHPVEVLLGFAQANMEIEILAQQHRARFGQIFNQRSMMVYT